MAKSRKSNSRTKRVYRRKPRINKKRRLTKRKAGCLGCCDRSSEKRRKMTYNLFPGVSMDMRGQDESFPPTAYELYLRQQEIESHANAPCANRMSRSSRREDLDPLILPHDIGGVYRSYNNVPKRPGLSRRR